MRERGLIENVRQILQGRREKVTLNSGTEITDSIIDELLNLEGQAFIDRYKELFPANQNFNDINYIKHKLGLWKVQFKNQ